MPLGASRINSLGRMLGRTALTSVVSGNAKISTAQSKFGSSSYLGDGSGDCIRITSSTLQMGTSNFTIECWVYLNAKNINHNIFDQRSTGTSVVPAIFVLTDNSVRYFVNGAYRITGASQGVTTGEWYHVAVSRSGTSTKLFLNGTQIGNTYSDSNNYANSPMTIGAYNDTTQILGSWNGYIDEFRISNVARYTANFTPSTAAFTNDTNTLLLLHMEGDNNSTTFTDDNS